MKYHKKILAFLLIIALILPMIQWTNDSVHAWEEWEECAHCGSKRSEDWLCDSCGGCGIETSNDCFLQHHCPCGNCYLDIPICNDCRQCLDCVSGDVMCVNCGECEDCVGVVCSGCQSCSNCVGFDEYCTSCEKFACCMGMGYCYECELCGDCTTMCSNEDCYHCEDCSGQLCDTCGQCAFCAFDYFCDNCGNCNECSGPICGGCNYCSDCSTICPDCEDCCSQCENLCESCNRCENCLGSTTCPDCHECIDCSGGTRCETCDYCSNCVNICEGCELVCSDCFNFCQECNRCNEYCIELCHGCADYCFDCKSSCENCGACEECSSLCEECEEICDSCANFCQDCNSCENCVKLCSECDEVCDTCEDFCDECGDVCPNCAEFCSDCHKCEGCVHLCHDCWEYCFDCKNHCHDCDSCEECVNLCEDCEEICDWCTDFCLDCNKCGDCTNLCDDCGEVCQDCGVFCTHCNLCQNCVNLCEECEVCSDCADFCFDCNRCENCVNLCSNCNSNCDKCLSFCQGCNCCSDCSTACPTCGEFCGMCETDWDFKFLNNNEHQLQCSCGGFVRKAESHWFRYVVSKPATETEDGIGHLKCADCDHIKEIVTIPATGEQEHIHDYSLWVTNSNRHVKHCACGASDPSSQGTHELIWVVDIEETIGDWGLKHEECILCGYELPGIPIPPIDHSHEYDRWNFDKYWHWRECTCGNWTDKGMHSMGEWIVTLEPTEKKPGSEERTCNMCPYKQVRVIPSIATEFTVVFNSNGGSFVADQIVQNGNKAIKPENPSRAGYLFTGWYTTISGTKSWNFDHLIYEPTSLYAQWEVEEIPEPPKILTDSLTKGVLGISYNETLKASGKTPITWTLVGGKLPKGLVLNSSGKINGIPSEYGNFTFIIKAENKDDYDLKNYTIIVDNKTIESISITKQPNKRSYIEGEKFNPTGMKVEILWTDGTRTDITDDVNYKEDKLTIDITEVEISYNNIELHISFEETVQITVSRYVSGGGSFVTSYTITTNTGPGGNIDSQQIVSVSAGRNAKFNIKPDKGYEIEDVKVNGKSIGPVSTYEFTNVNKNHTISATFKKIIEPVDDFTDVLENAWYYEAVKMVREKGWFGGTSTSTFSPDTIMTRGMMVTALWRMEGKPTGKIHNFHDVATGKYYTASVSWAAANGIVEGYSKDLFGPEDNITREQMATILYRYAKYKGYDTSQKGIEINKFTDYEKISEYALPALVWAVGTELVQGSQNNLMPKDSETRAQVAAILMRFSQNVEK